MSDKQLMNDVMEKISNDPAARRTLAAAIGTGSADEVRRAAAGLGVELSEERAAQLTASVRANSTAGYLFLT